MERRSSPEVLLHQNYLSDQDLLPSLNLVPMYPKIRYPPNLQTIHIWYTHNTLTVGGRITVGLVSRLTGLDLIKQENMLLFVCSETTESKPVKLETSAVILTPTMSVLWSTAGHNQTVKHL